MVREAAAGEGHTRLLGVNRLLKRLFKGVYRLLIGVNRLPGEGHTRFLGDAREEGRAEEGGGPRAYNVGGGGGEVGTVSGGRRRGRRRGRRGT